MAVFFSFSKVSHFTEHVHNFYDPVLIGFLDKHHFFFLLGPYQIDFMFLGFTGSVFGGIKKKNSNYKKFFLIKRILKKILSKMASSSTAWLSVTVKRGQMVIRNRSIISCSWEANFGSLLGPEFEEETVHEVVISQNENSMCAFYLRLRKKIGLFQAGQLILC